MYLESGSYEFADESEIGTDFHWLRACFGENIESCAQRLGVSIDIIDKIERGQFDNPQINLNLLIRYASLYHEKLVLTVRCIHGIY